MRQRLLLASITVAATAALVASATTLSTALAATGPTASPAYSTTAGCGKTPTLKDGTHTIQSSGQSRSYILSLPSSYDKSHPYRLVFGLHWLNGSASNVATGGSDGAVGAFYGQKQLNGSGTIFVAPQGLNAGWGNSNGNDITLMDNITKEIETDLCVDTSMVFSMGWSYGGAMSYALACARPSVFRAVVVYSGANLSGCNGGTQPVAYFGIHGIHDSVLNISQGRSIRDTFVKADGCTAASPSEPSRGSLTHNLFKYSGCKAGYPVWWAAFDGDHTPNPADGSSATTAAKTWTSAAANQFLSQFTSQLTSTSASK